MAPEFANFAGPNKGEHNPGPPVWVAEVDFGNRWLDLGVCRKRRKWQYRYRKTGHPNIFGGFRRFYLMIVYLGSYCHALGGWDADSGRLAQLEGLKTLLSGLPWPLSPARVAYG